ncbi:transmembrane protein, putative (macronuclear) [Tetrahymena thermophila SB210]|uniref:Transmembrane protein, putative n=1 Tax=Tetrahymena thermophila (strain SB210) TaxID=312017 RepID=Q22AK5_TETTS|nr:transmembrane protein, putative [Tetrahymena thermophila SB210]EAR82311.2 transmembrane protein, putative [Tetrahymena thermophila SB210]|eukprot:XP_001029974.2 transmembrane protein, putative [Tetrahymena thermophila SB210]
MENQLLISQPLDFKTQFRQDHKKVLNIFYAFSCILGIFALLITTVYILCNMNGRTIFLFALLSQFLRILQTFCNYNVTHSGQYSGSEIISVLQIHNSSICSSISHSDETSVVYNLALKYLQDQCKDDSSCINLPSLHVYYIYSEASLQLAALIIAGILEFLYIVIIIKIKGIVKQTNQKIINNAFIKKMQVAQTLNQNQNVSNQPIQVSSQIVPGVIVSNNQVLPNQNGFNNQYSNPYNYPNHGQQQQNLNLGMQHQQYYQ